MKAVIFDMDGLMIDSERLITKAMVNTGRLFGYDNIKILCEKSTGVTSAQTKRIFIEHLGEDFPYDEFLKTAKESYLKDIEENGLPTKKGLFELLDFLKENQFSLAVATSTREVTALKNLERINAVRYFDCIICGDKVEKSKPDPEIYLKAAEMLTVEPKLCYVLEDSYNGIKSAYRAGMKPIMIPDLLPFNDEIKPFVYKKCDCLLDVIEIINSEKITCGR